MASMSAFIGLSIALFRMRVNRQDRINDEIAKAYEHLRKHTLNPILESIFAGKRGRYKPGDFFNTPEVAIKLDEYRGHLFRFNRVGGMGGSIMMTPDLSLKTSVAIALLTLALIVMNEVFVNSINEEFADNVPYVAVMYIIILGIPAAFVAGFLRDFLRIDSLFREKIGELKGGLP